MEWWFVTLGDILLITKHCKQKQADVSFFATQSGNIKNLTANIKIELGITTNKMQNAVISKEEKQHINH